MYAAWAAVTAAAAIAESEIRNVTRIQDASMGIPALTDARERHAHTLYPGDCASCGSQEFRVWRGTSVCAYCRSVAAPSAATVEDRRLLTNPHAAWGGRYADPLGITRRYAAERLTTT